MKNTYLSVKKAAPAGCHGTLSALGKLKQEDSEFETSLDYIVNLRLA
jgi:hypothetical protein